ncbi:MAG: hypothetical protein ACT6S0_27380 [Roseateles sp.]|uniref:hypothetical protein n=1 Tax=Roseateles sp. TaxID=1971397 RepID=UPI0040364662
MTGATVRVLDPTGKVIATGRPVSATTGAYGPVPLVGQGPFRVEACGTVGDVPLCVWGATNNGGTLNLTPLTSAITVLASGQAPETLMGGAAQGLTNAALSSAHTQLRAAVAPALADAGLASDFDLLAGPLTPGVHTGHDRALDAVAVGLGFDTRAFVTLSSRLGAGTAYLEPGTTQGSFSIDPAAAGLDLIGVDALFASMNTAMATNTSCQPGLNAVFDANVRASLDPGTTFGGTLAAQVICLRLAGVLGDGEVLFGGKLLPTTLGRCDFDGGDPVCRVNLVFQNSKGFQRRLGSEQAAVRRPTGWTFLGNRLEVQASANARLVLVRRVDAAAPDSYARYLDISIPAVGVSGGDALQCARVSQKDGSGADVALALYKRGSGSLLSLWSISSNDATPSLDPATGATRGANVVALPVPNGAAGDATARNFARAGRALKIELYGDAGCTTPLTGADGPVISVELAGLLPIAATSHSGQPWPALSGASHTSLASLKGAANATISYGPAWALPRRDLALNRAQLCTDAACNTKLAELELTAGALLAAFNPPLGGTALAAADYKLLRITGRMPDGLVLQLDSQSCAAQVASLRC